MSASSLDRLFLFEFAKQKMNRDWFIERFIPFYCYQFVPEANYFCISRSGSGFRFLVLRGRWKMEECLWDLEIQAARMSRSNLVQMDATRDLDEEGRIGLRNGVCFFLANLVLAGLSSKTKPGETELRG